MHALPYKSIVRAFPFSAMSRRAQIKAFAQARGAEYPLFAKIDVNGSDAHPLYKAREKGDEPCGPSPPQSADPASGPSPRTRPSLPRSGGDPEHRTSLAMSLYPPFQSLYPLF